MPQFDQSGFDSSGFDSSGSTPPPSPVPVYRVFGNPGAGAASTYGQLRFRLTKALPGIDPELIDGWIQDRYTEALDELPWQRAERTVTLQTVAPFTLGTVAIAAGATTLVLSGASWATTMTGRAFRVTGDDAYYEFTQTGPTTGSIDRPYEGLTATAAAYSVFQSVYQLPADLRILGDVRLQSSPHPLERKSRADINAISANRNLSGDVEFYAPYMDDSSTLPRMQVEIFPVPDIVTSLILDYTADAAPLSATATTLAPWVRTGMLFEGVYSNGLRHLKDYNGAQFAQARFNELLAQMKRIENQRTPPTPMKMAAKYTRHRLQRALNSSSRQVRLP